MGAANYSVVQRDGGALVLLEPHGAAWSLPTHQHSRPHDIRTEVSRRFGIDSVVTGTVAQVPGAAGMSTVYAHENSSADPTGGARWVGSADLDGLDIGPAEVRTVLAGWFARTADGKGSLPRVPWARDGWFGTAASWLIGQLRDRGIATAGPVEQFLISPWSCTLRVPVGEGHAYLKAAPPAFGYEPTLTQTLAGWFPDNIVPVLAVEPEQGWLLSADIGPGSCIEDTTNAEQLPAYLKAVARYAQIQKEAASHVDLLAGLGVPDRRPAALPALFDDLLADTATLLVGEDDGLSTTDHRRLARFAPTFERTCARLAEVELPDTLVHVDFWHGNISFRGNGDVIFDWAESGIGHPMCSLTTVAREFEVNDLPDGAAMRQALTDAYLAQWSDHCAPERLQEAYRLAQPAAILCRAQSWRDSISSLTEPERYRLHRRAVATNLTRLLPYLP